MSEKGVSVAVVTDNNDPDKLGRVRVRLRGHGKRQPSPWARIAVPMAGKSRGTYFLPEIDDEVLVAFENGDPAHPYVIGALWNDRDPPPEGNGGGNDRRLIRSRKGHQLTFDDGESGAIDLRLNDGRCIRLDDQAVTIDDGKGNAISIRSGSGTIEIQSSRAIAISSPEVSIAAGSSMELKAAGKLVLKGALVEIN